ncbi:FAD-dependent oxidoreductase [Agromyces sp. SYSU T00194]|uniref:FAD-dependent oxidoreductase n=1 Tax=Agromyces chitinivorans TaxID=3158560 RepID=UPI0033938F55
MGTALTPSAAARMLDVAVVGGGPVGLLLACLLARRGLRVEVYEARATPTARSRAIGVHPPGLRALDAVGVGAAARAAGVPIRDGRVSCRGRVLGALDFAEADPDLPYVLALPQAVTERLLAERFAAERPGALHRGTPVTAVRQRDGFVEFDVGKAGRDAVGLPPASVTRAARILVGADGVRSTVRSAGGIRWRRRPGRADYVMGDVPDRTDAPGSALLHFEPGGVVESFPLPGGMRRWVAMVDGRMRRRRRPDEARGDAPDTRGGAPATPGEAADAELARIVAARTGARIDDPLPDARAFGARQHLAARFVAGRVVLVGDAAHEVSPIGGQGMNLGWLDALALDRALAAGFAGGRAPGATGRALAAYDRERRRAASRAIRRAGFNMAMGGPARGARLAARNAAVRLLALGPFRRRLARAFTMQGL